MKTNSSRGSEPPSSEFENVTAQAAAASERRQRPRSAPGFGSRRGEKLPMGLTRTELIQQYWHQVRIIAVKLARDLPASVDVEDLFSMGLMGLLAAGERFDPKRKIAFKTFAEFRIRGAMIDGLRQQDWVPRSAREKADSIQQAREDYVSRNGRAPSDLELSREMGISPGKFAEMLANLGNQKLVNIEDLPPNLQLSEEADGSDPFRETVRNEAREVVAKMLKQLPEREQMILKLYYFRGLNLFEIGEIMELSGARVSQLHSEAILKLKASLKNQVQAVETMFVALIDE